MSRNIFITGTATTELLMCRGCLATDARLYDMRENRLMEAYSTFLSSAAQGTDDLPQYLCSYCAVLLLKCDAFRAKCIEAQAALKNALHNLEVTPGNIKPIDRSNIRQSNIQIIYISEYDSKQNGCAENMPATDFVEYSNEVLKVEFDTETNNLIDEENVKLKDNQINYLLMKILESDDTDNLKELLKDFKEHFASNISNNRNELAEAYNYIQYSNKTRNEILNIFKMKHKLDTPKDKSETTVSNKQTMLKQEDIESDNKSNIQIKENMNLKNKTEVKPYDIPIHNGNTNDLSSNTDSEDDVAIADLQTKPVTKTKPQIANKATKQHSVKPKSKKDKSENLSTIYNMDDVDLSKEDQLKEFYDRKKSDSYLLSTFKCDICYKGFLMEETYNSHMLIHNDKSGKYVCEICHSHFMSQSRLTRHRSNHKKRYTCKECGFVTKYLSQAKEHFKWHGGVKDKCKYCGKGFSGQSTYYFHLKVSHPTSDELVRCEICGESCNGSVGLRLHEKRAHKEMRSPDCHCSGCDTQFYCSSALKAHQGAAGLCDPRAKFCVRCGRSFDTEQLLREHEAEERKPRTSFKCEVCSKDFKGVTSYKKHLRTHSSSLIRNREDNKVKKRAVCEICGKVLANKNLLKQHHANKHSTDSPYQCGECPKSFRSAFNLQLHTRTHTGERPYRCPHCTKAFKTYTNMKRHKLVHSGERQHSCEICGKAFKTKCDAKTHIKTVHMKIPMPPRIRRRNKKTD